MQKFPLRMKDNDLLITEIFKSIFFFEINYFHMIKMFFFSRDPAGESITALSVYLTPKTSVTGNW